LQNDDRCIKLTAETSAVSVPVDLAMLGTAKLVALVQAFDAERYIKKAKLPTLNLRMRARSASIFVSLLTNSTLLQLVKNKQLLPFL
jgi:hypothetical protein